MSNINCEACSSLILNNIDDVTDELLASIRCGNGLTKEDSTSHAQVMWLVDCLIGKLQGKIDGYDECEWKEFAKLLMANLTNTLEATTMSDIGAWDNIKALWETILDISRQGGGKVIPVENGTLNFFSNLDGASRNCIMAEVKQISSQQSVCNNSVSSKTALIRLHVDACTLTKGSATIIGQSIGKLSITSLKGAGLTNNQINRIKNTGFQQTCCAITVNSGGTDSGVVFNIALRKNDPDNDFLDVYVHSIGGTLPAVNNALVSTIQAPLIYIADA